MPDYDSNTWEAIPDEESHRVEVKPLPDDIRLYILREIIKESEASIRAEEEKIRTCREEIAQITGTGVRE